MSSPSLPPSVTSTSRSLLRSTDRTLTRLTSILSTPIGVDKFLLTIYYTLKLLYPQITRLRSLRFRRFISSFISKARAGLLPGETLITVLEQRDDDFLSELDTGMRNAAALIGDVRIFLRLWALLGIYGSVKRVLTNPPKDQVTKWIVMGQLGSIGVYQVLENVAYLAGKGILRNEWVAPEKQKRMWLVGCRFWGVYVALEAARLVREWQIKDLGVQKVQEKTEGEGAVGVQRQQEVQAWRRAWWANAAYSPMTVHYSVDGGILSDDQLGLLGVIIGFIGFGHLWKQSA